MRGLRHSLMEYADNLIDFGRVVGSSISPTVKNVLVDVLGIETGEEGEDRGERASAQPLYGHAGVIMRPAAKTVDGSCELIFARVGDELIPLASRDVRWQVELEEGEVVVRSMSDTPARIYLKPDGSVVVEAERIELGAQGASDAAALASKTNARLDAVADALDAFCGATPATNDGGAALQTAVKGVWNGATPLGTPTPDADVGSAKVKIES